MMNLGMQSDSAEERRITLRLLSYWERRRAGRPMPGENEMDAADIADLWEYCFMAQTKDIQAGNMRFSYLGHGIKEVFQEALADSDGTSYPDMEALSTAYEKVIRSAAPLVTESEFTTPGGDIFKYRQVLLPLGQGNEVRAVFGGMRFLRIVAYN